MRNDQMHQILWDEGVDYNTIEKINITSKIKKLINFGTHSSRMKL